MKETELYQPIKNYFEAQGYKVRAEVKHCDVVATKADELLIIELKTSANMTLLIQATERQSMSDSVYVAIPEPKKIDKQWRGIQRVIKRLELGLLVIEKRALGDQVIKYFDPMTSQARKNKRKKSALLKELAERRNDLNIGGSTQQKIVTAYKENALLIACCLKKLGPSSAKTLKALGTGDKTSSILSSNHYSWFARVERGVFELTDVGIKEMMDYKQLLRLSEKFLLNYKKGTH